MVKVLIVGHEPVGKMMTGPSIRWWEMASVLSREFDVTLAAPAGPELPAAPFRLVPYRVDTPGVLESLARESDAILVSGYLLQAFPELGRSGKRLIVDLYDPFPVENLELRREHSLDDRMAMTEHDFHVVSHLLRVGDFFICGSERQRVFWIGMLAANGRINPRTYQSDPSFRDLIDVVSMGIPDIPPESNGRALKGAFEGIETSDFLIVWPGGLWNWLDPVTAVEAIHLLSDEAPDVKLFFPGLRHPYPERIAAMETPAAVVRRAEELGLLNRRVFYRDWTPYTERTSYLLDADAALSLHFDHLETHLAVRIRLLDCLWAEVPVIATQGDVIAEEMAERGLARLVPPRDPTAVAEAILSLRSDGSARARRGTQFRELAARYRWSVVCRPLVKYLRQPRHAADRSKSAPTVAAAAAPLPTPRLRPADRWRTEVCLDLPFDQYQRYREVAQVLEALRGEQARTLRVLDVGAGPAVLKRFLDASDRIVSLDLQPNGSVPLAVAADAAQLPFGDDAFDFTVTLDTLEHLPSHKRLQMISECIRVAKQGSVIQAPFASPTAIAAEQILFEFIKCVLGVEHPSLREHLFNGLPDRAVVEEHLQQLGYPYLVRPSGYIHRWLAMMLLKHYLLSLPNSDAVHRQIDRYYNLHYFAADRRAPSYRLLIYVAKTGDASTLARVSQALEGPCDRAASDQDDVRDLAQLGLLVDLVALRSANEHHQRSAVDEQGIRELEARLSDLERQLAQAVGALAERDAALAAAQRALQLREAELTAALDLIDRIGRGRVMRLMNAVHSIIARRRG